MTALGLYKAIASHLNFLGFSILETIEPSFEADGTINVTPNVHVQVGEDYLIVVRETRNGGYVFSPVRDNSIDLVHDLREAIKESEAEA